ncbi:MAG TPA: cytochrome c [Woeseiaceae bacterium]|nr:cytochrome c [Woeseiaceae bacterium]
MCMRNGWLALLLVAAAAAGDDGPGLGMPVPGAALEALDFTVLPDGTGLPPGEGSASTGAVLYRQHCLACHGENGSGGANDRLAGGQGSLDGPAPVKTVGSYWPYATTLFDYLRRAMPYNVPGSLSNDQIYALTAYLLALNGIVDDTAVMNRDSLPAVRMPNRDNFDRAWPEE